jgi:hypothetical protein
MELGTLTQEQGTFTQEQGAKKKNLLHHRGRFLKQEMEEKEGELGSGIAVGKTSQGSSGGTEQTMKDTGRGSG